MEKSRKWLAQGILGVSMLGMAALAGTANAQTVEEETGMGKAYATYPTDKVLVTKVKHYGMVSWKIAAAGGTFYFETGNDNPKGSTGFHSAFDKHWNDWIGNDGDKNFIKNPPDFCTGGNQWRGFPQFLEDNFDHPQTEKNPGGKTRWTDADGKDLAFTDKLEGEHLVLHSFNAANELEYHFFPTHAAIKVIKAGAAYSFLWEGNIGGDAEQGPKDYYVLEDGKKSTTFSTSWTLEAKRWPSPFLYMVDSDEAKTQIVYLGAKGLNADHEDEGWIQKDPCKDSNFNQQLFSFGRGSNKRNLKGTDAVAVFGFLPKGEHATISDFVKARLADPFKPVGGGGTTPTGGAGGSTGAGGATGSGGSTAVTSGGTTATGGSTTTSGGATGSSGGATSSGGSTTAKGGSTTASTSGGSTTSTSGGKTTSTGGSSSTGGSTASSSSGSSGGCSFGLGSEGRGLHGLGLILGFGAVAVWLRGRRRKN